MTVTPDARSDTLPSIDLGLAADSGQGRRECIEQLVAACDDTGFFVVTGHGVPRPVIDGAIGAARRFFDLPVEAKNKIARPRPELNRGYIGFGTETLARLAGNETPPDAKELFAVGPQDYPLDDYHTCPAALPHWGPNMWPGGLPGFRDSVLDYGQHLRALTDRLGGLLSSALDLDPSFFGDALVNGSNQLRLIHYPHYDQPAPDQLRAGAHTDLGMLTILHSNDAAGGLEVQDPDGRWLPVNPTDNFIVNIGDALMRWTNGRWRSTPHRVANPPAAPGTTNTDRISLAYFAIPSYDTILHPLDPCVGPEGALYPPISMGDYRAARFASTANSS